MSARKIHGLLDSNGGAQGNKLWEQKGQCEWMQQPSPSKYFKYLRRATPSHQACATA